MSKATDQADAPVCNFCDSPATQRVSGLWHCTPCVDRICAALMGTAQRIADDEATTDEERLRKAKEALVASL